MKKIFVIILGLILINSCRQSDDIQLTKGFTIDQIIINSIPKNSNGADWDSDGSSPEIYIIIKSGTDTLFNGLKTNYTDSELPINFSYGFPLTAPDDIDDKTYIIDIKDFDGAQEDDLIERLYFKASDTRTLFELDINEGDCSITLFLI